MRGVDSLDVAIVHDYLNQRGGAERMVLELSHMWPKAPIYTSLYRPHSTFPGFQDRDVRPSLLDPLPIDRGFRNLFPLYPAAFRSLGKIEADVVIASSSGWAHMANAAPEALRVVYCHTPARWLYGGTHFQSTTGYSIRSGFARSVFGPLRRLDRAAARRADLYVTNSQAVRRRINMTYGIDATVVYGPVDVDRFRPAPRGERLLVVSRLLPYKNVDLVIRAANRAGIGLDIVGDGPLRSSLRSLAGPTVRLHGTLDDPSVVELMQNCRAVVVAAEEDFGLVAVESQAAGKPVVAYGRGGSRETVVEGITGTFFDELDEDRLLEAVERSDCLDTPPEQIAAQARRFSAGAFRLRVTQALENALHQPKRLDRTARSRLSNHTVPTTV